LTIEKIQQCPAFKGVSNTGADPYTGYNYNTSYIGLIDTLSPVDSARITDVGRPTETALFGDGQCPTGGANKYMRAPFSHPGDTLLPDSARHAGAQGYRHLRQTNVAFCDGHAGPWSEVYTATDPAAKKVLDTHNAEEGVPIGFLSPDNGLYDLK
jgi:prepilin-type processing-associated H-X9-DG protein